MSNSKNYNSILFLTTLSVYLGLVLVGASPQVLAQQVTFVNKFEIQNEIEFEDDLDKNPEDAESSDFKTISQNVDFEDSDETDLLVKNEQILNSFVENVFKQTNCTNENCLKFTAKSEINKFPTAFDFIKANLTKDFFDLPLVSQNSALKDTKNLSADEENISAENEQIFTVTRLPRGSLNVLL